MERRGAKRSKAGGSIFIFYFCIVLLESNELFFGLTLIFVGLSRLTVIYISSYLIFPRLDFGLSLIFVGITRLLSIFQAI